MADNTFTQRRNPTSYRLSPDIIISVKLGEAFVDLMEILPSRFSYLQTCSLSKYIKEFLQVFFSTLLSLNQLTQKNKILCISTTGKTMGVIVRIKQFLCRINMFISYTFLIKQML